MCENDDESELFQPCDEWHTLIVAADAAGRWAARQLARSCSAWHLGRIGGIDIHVEPFDSPVATWLHSTGQAVAAETRTGVLIPVAVTAADLHPVAEAADKARSLLVAHAYAVAYSSVLADEAGVATEIRIVVDTLSPSQQRSRALRTPRREDPVTRRRTIPGPRRGGPARVAEASCPSVPSARTSSGEQVNVATPDQ